jgi:hypothetical protein
MHSPPTQGYGVDRLLPHHYGVGFLRRDPGEYEYWSMWILSIVYHLDTAWCKSNAASLKLDAYSHVPSAQHRMKQFLEVDLGMRCFADRLLATLKSIEYTNKAESRLGSISLLRPTIHSETY